MKYGFDNEKYLKIQSEHIKERIAQFGNKLYLEFGGKLFDDYHASRVLPGFQPDSKLKMLMQLRDYAEIVIVISAVDIEKNKVRTDLGITYDEDVLRLRDEFIGRGLLVNSVVITHYRGQEGATAYRQRLERLGITTYYVQANLVSTAIEEALFGRIPKVGLADNHWSAIRGKCDDKILVEPSASIRRLRDCVKELRLVLHIHGDS